MAYYLFPGTMSKRLEAIRFCTNDLENAHKIYTQSTRQYLGLGSILQFIPGTYANLARRQLTKLLASEIEEYLADNVDPDETSWLQVQPDIASLSSFLNLSPLFYLLIDIRRGFNIACIKFNRKQMIPDILIKFPFIKAFFKNDHGYIEFLSFSDIGKNIFALLKNPVRLIDDALEFLHLIFNRALEVGSTARSHSSLPRIILKGFISLGLGLLKTPVKILKHGINLVENVLNAVLIKPLVHVVKSFGLSFQRMNRPHEMEIFATVKIFNSMRALRKLAEDKPQTPNSTPKPVKGNSTYYFMQKDKVYEQQTNPEDLVAFKSINDTKSSKMHGLFSIVTAKKYQGIDFEAANSNENPIDEAIAEAKALLSSAN